MEREGGGGREERATGGRKGSRIQNRVTKDAKGRQRDAKG